LKQDKPKNNPSEITFETAILQLENVVQKLESGNLPLEEATGLYEKGMELSKLCNKILTSAELRITQIQTSYGDQLPSSPESELDE